MRCLIRYDVPGWAFHRRAMSFAHNRPKGWVVEAAPDAHPRTRSEWDIVVMLDAQGNAAEYRDARKVKFIGSHCWLHAEYDPADWRTRGVHTNRCARRAPEMVDGFDVVAVHNHEQRKFFSAFHPNVIRWPYLVDRKIFRPSRRNWDKPKLRVGWCQQMSGGLQSFKGLSDVLVPVIAEIGDAVEWDVLTPAVPNALDENALIDWYNSIDIYLCTSSAEGGPHGPFEAASCGCVVISTDVGEVADWDELRQLGMIVPTYRNAAEASETARQMVCCIKHLLHYRGTCQAWSERLMESVEASHNARDAGAQLEAAL